MKSGRLSNLSSLNLALKRDFSVANKKIGAKNKPFIDVKKFDEEGYYQIYSFGKVNSNRVLMILLFGGSLFFCYKIFFTSYSEDYDGDLFFFFLSLFVLFFHMYRMRKTVTKV